MHTEDVIAPQGLRDPQQLYELWERQQWQSYGVDLSEDEAHWSSLSEAGRESLLRALGAFFMGEERVASQFTGLIGSATNQSEHSFLTTQQVDEVRHTQFFDRFFREVVDVRETCLDERVELERRRVGGSFLQLFDDRLIEVDRRLLHDPTDLGAKVDFVTTYHMVIEGMLGIAGQRSVADFLERRGMFPGLMEGFELIARDEHRHIAYGTWFLARTVAQSPVLAARVRARLAELVPLAVRVLRDDLTSVHSEETATLAVNALRRRMNVMGIAPPEALEATAA
jgi:ribonucleoside-diphosphate reductase beta chain